MDIAAACLPNSSSGPDRETRLVSDGEGSPSLTFALLFSVQRLDLVPG